MQGVIQGVGFRPLIYKLANEHQLTGFVGNQVAGVFIEVQGPPAAVASFEAQLISRRPVAAVIDSISTEELPPIVELGFRIVESESVQPDRSPTPVSPDLATCGDCLRELFDPLDRRYRYPFLNCTNCGPRFTILRGLPYDRPLTTLADFLLCPVCEAEYRDPENRRYHAQPIACPSCGPTVWFLKLDQIDEAIPSPDDPKTWPSGEQAIQQTLNALKLGQIVAIKGLGGVHLACDATNDRAIETLRQRKGRSEKPFALMAPSLEVIGQYADLTEPAKQLLRSPQRPIVLLRRRSEPTEGPRLSELVAPGNPRVGFMLPYTPLHYLIVNQGPLVMTSGNLSDEPIARDNAEALERLSSLADGFLLHDRPIQVVCDDSVVQVFEGRAAPIRRSRGYAPSPLVLPGALSAGPTVLAVGGELKATFALAIPPYLHLSQHIGDMGNLETLQGFERAVEHFLTLYQARPDRVACDLHPDYLSTRWAERFSNDRGIPLIRVQHHHAHAAALMLEHGLDGKEPVIGVIFDGTGFGSDGTIWGGEVLLADYQGFQRFAQLKDVRLPGGDSAIQRPGRAALAHLKAAGIPWEDDLPCVRDCPESERKILARMIDGEIRCLPTSSMGRLFDAVAALLGVRQASHYEAQAAIELEALAGDAIGPPLAPFALEFPPDSGTGIIDPGPVLKDLVAAHRRGESRELLAGRFHRTVAEMVVEVANRARQQAGLNVVALSGGVFQNLLLLRLTVVALRSSGFQTLVHQALPTNDGGLAAGQAALALGSTLAGANPSVADSPPANE